MALEGTKAVWVTGSTAFSKFPLADAVQGSFEGGGSDAFVAKLTPAGDSLIFSTYLGGSSDDVGYGVAVDQNRASVVAGYTHSKSYFKTSGGREPARPI